MEWLLRLLRMEIASLSALAVDATLGWEREITGHTAILFGTSAVHLAG
jgi:hypothetical protein